MKPWSMLAGALVALALVAGSRAAAPPALPKSAPPPAGAYTLDKAHASLVFRIDPASLASDNCPAHFMAMLHGPAWHEQS